MASSYPDHLALATTADEVEAVMRSGRVACLMGMEGGHSINASLGTLRMLRALGVRYMTLTHGRNTSWADSATDETALGGLSQLGEQIVAEMNRIGMLVDLSHVSTDVMRHALRISSEPVIFSHSSARAICDSSRNVPDDVLETLADNGGVCMVTFVPMFVSPAVAEWFQETIVIAEAHDLDPLDFDSADPIMAARVAVMPSATVTDVVRHIDHIRDVAGIDHVGTGGDYDGCPVAPVGLPDVSSYPVLFEALADRGWSLTELGKLAQGNALRVLRAADEVATTC